jgi:D-alanyl-D-alanine carboxypeptidase/D-alanyl-D-alanine-endopeptidase (penicillin-binding protein 4)
MIDHEDQCEFKRSPLGLLVLCLVVFFWPSGWLLAGELSPPSAALASGDALMIADREGAVLVGKNESQKYIPASTLKVFTALVAVERLGKAYRFKTEFYQDPEQDLKIKGYGDPMLISEVLERIADTLAMHVRHLRDVVIDDSYFAQDIDVPDNGLSTNPYDAPLGALCANFNTVFFKRDPAGRIVSAESQTPMLGYAMQKIQKLGLTEGRHAIFRSREEIAHYAGELLVHFLRERGVQCHGDVRMGMTGANDRLIYTYRSHFTLGQVLGKMLTFSNNFVANQIVLAMGAREYGPPGTVEKGIRVLTDYSREVLNLQDIALVEGSGISRENRLSAMDMLAILRRFEPYEYMLPHEGRVRYKSGSLRGVQTRVGYIDCEPPCPRYFVIFLNRPNPDIAPVMSFVERLALEE